MTLKKQLDSKLLKKYHLTAIWKVLSFLSFNHPIKSMHFKNDYGCLFLKISSKVTVDKAKRSLLDEA